MNAVIFPTLMYKQVMGPALTRDHTKMCMAEVKVTGAIYDHTIPKVTSEGVGKSSPAGLSAHTAGLSTL